MTDPHFIRRHGGWFRPGAHGYTLKLSEAGVFSGDEARRYSDVEGLTIHPVSTMVARLADEIALRRSELEQQEQRLAHIRTLLNPPTTTRAG